jgi:poly(beta-D-mannuronate) lyase
MIISGFAKSMCIAVLLSCSTFASYAEPMPTPPATATPAESQDVAPAEDQDAAPAEDEDAVLAEDESVAAAEEDDTVCFAPFEPVTKLAYPSRYTKDSKSRSDFDEKADAAVNAALKPVDDFIKKLASEANKSLTRKDEKAVLAADCVVDRIHEWAVADALSDLDTEGARMSAPSRVAAIAIAYAQVKPTATADDRQAVIEAWLRARVQSSMTYFDTEAPPRASSNNLRAWAALGAAQVGLLLDDQVILDWAVASVNRVACTANADGSLPNEMFRGRLALHYQIHAVGPLVFTAGLLKDKYPDLLQTCDGAIIRAAQFAVAAAKDPKIVEPIAGEKQTFNPDPAKLKNFEFAWITAFLAQVEDPQIEAFAQNFEEFSNSKLGGKQSLIWN